MTMVKRPAFPALPWRTLLFLLPFLAGVIAKLLHSDLWFGDYQAVACAGRKVLAGQAIYDLNLSCDGMRPSVFVYIAPVAQAAAWLQAAMGETAFFAGYLGLFVAGLGALMVLPIVAPGVPGPWNLRLPFAVLWSGSAVMWGNVAVLLHAAILGAALLLETAPWLFLLAVVLAAWVKPVFLAYLAVLLLADMPVRRRIALAVSGAVAGMAPTIAFSATGGALADQWLDVLSHFVYDTTPGYGFYGWLALIGINSNSPLISVAWATYAATLTLCGYALAEGLKLKPRERMWLGLSLAVLIIPRLLANDLFLVGPGLVVVARRFGQWMAERPGVPVLDRLAGRHASRAVLVMCSVALAGGLTGLGDYATPLALLGFALCLVWQAKAVLRIEALTLFAPLLARLRPRVGVRP